MFNEIFVSAAMLCGQTGVTTRCLPTPHPLRQAAPTENQSGQLSSVLETHIPLPPWLTGAPSHRRNDSGAARAASSVSLTGSPPLGRLPLRRSGHCLGAVQYGLRKAGDPGSFAYWITPDRCLSCAPFQGSVVWIVSGLQSALNSAGWTWRLLASPLHTANFPVGSQPCRWSGRPRQYVQCSATLGHLDQRSRGRPAATNPSFGGHVYFLYVTDYRFTLNRGLINQHCSIRTWQSELYGYYCSAVLRQFLSSHGDLRP